MPKESKHVETPGEHSCPFVGCKYSSDRIGDISRHFKDRHCKKRPWACPHEGCASRTKQKCNMARHIKCLHSTAPRRDPLYIDEVDTADDAPQTPAGLVASTSQLDADPEPENELSGLMSPPGSPTAETVSSAWSTTGELADASDLGSEFEPGSTDIPSTPSGYTSSPAATIVLLNSVAASTTVSALPSPATIANPNLATLGPSAVQYQSAGAVEPAHAPSPLGLSPSVEFAGLNNELEFPGLDFSNGLCLEGVDEFSDTLTIDTQPSAVNGQMPLLPPQVAPTPAVPQQVQPYGSQQLYQSVQPTLHRLPVRLHNLYPEAMPYWIPQPFQQPAPQMGYLQNVQMQYFGHQYPRLHPTLPQSQPILQQMPMPEPMPMLQPMLQVWGTNVAWPLIPETALLPPGAQPVQNNWYMM